MSGVNNFKRVSEVLEERFEIISPRGDLMTREKLLAMLWEFYGGYRDQQYRIWTEGLRSRGLSERQLLVTYREWEQLEGEKKGRESLRCRPSRSRTSRRLGRVEPPVQSTNSCYFWLLGPDRVTEGNTPARPTVL